MHYGKHIALEGTVHPADKMWVQPIMEDPDKLGEILKGLVNEIGMRVLAGPCGKYEKCNELLDRGASSIILLYESHAAIHCYPYRLRFFVDVFSCKDYPTSKVLGYLRVKLRMHGYELTEAKRGKDWRRMPDVSDVRKKNNEDLNNSI